MGNSPVLADPVNPQTFEDVTSQALADYRSGQALMDQLGAGRLLNPAMTGTLLALRRMLLEETGASTAGEMMLIDIAVTAYANAVRVQSMIGNTSLVIEAELFGQPSLRAKWKKSHGDRPEDLRGLAVDEHVAMLRDRLMPLIERFHRMIRQSIEAIERIREAPSLQVERDGAIRIILVEASI